MTFLDFIKALIPQDPWVGPPLPRSLNIQWPWASQGQETNSSLSLQSFVKGVGESLPKPPNMASSYENVEEWSVNRDPKGRIEKITVHRTAKEK